MKKKSALEVTTGTVRQPVFAGNVHRQSPEVMAQIRSTLPADLELGHLLDPEHPYLAYASLLPAVSARVTRNKRTGFVTVRQVKAAAGAKSRKTTSAVKARKTTSAAKSRQG